MAGALWAMNNSAIVALVNTLLAPMATLAVWLSLDL